MNQSVLKEISPEYSLQGLRLKLKLQSFGHLMWRTDSLEKTLMLGKIEGRRGRGWQRMRWLDGITDSMDMSLSRLQELVRDGSLACCSAWGCMPPQLEKNHVVPTSWQDEALARHGVSWVKYSFQSRFRFTASTKFSCIPCCSPTRMLTHICF